MKVPYLVFALLSSLAVAQPAVGDDCQCPQIKCRATTEFESCRCVNAAELACKKNCPNYVSTKWRKCTLPQKEVTALAAAPTPSTAKEALPLPTAPILLLPDPILPIPVPSPLVLPLPDLPLVPGFPPASKPTPRPKPTPSVLPDLPKVPGCECEQMMCIQSFPDSCHCEYGVAKDCYDKCGGKSPGSNTCPPKDVSGAGLYGDGPVKRDAAPEPQRSTVPIPVNIPKVVAGAVGALENQACNYEERLCAQVWPQSCICANVNKYNRYLKCGGVVPKYQTCTSPPKPSLPTTIKTTTRTTATTERPGPTPKPVLQKVQICGGGRGSQLQACPSGFTCVNDPYSDAPCGLECDRTGICVEEKLCGGFAGFKCTKPGQVCLDDPRDDCNSKTGGADCGGLCFYPPALRAPA
ncbi:hypothetical protein E8E11_004156 [Didymella keratinophila]|nr:hypothetical protein E8E11_004156 [Didymella keratinophila]